MKGGFGMSDGKFGIFGNNSEILFFILVFLILFCNKGIGFGCRD